MFQKVAYAGPESLGSHCAQQSSPAGVPGEGEACQGEGWLHKQGHSRHVSNALRTHETKRMYRSFFYCGSPTPKTATASRAKKKKDKRNCFSPTSFRLVLPLSPYFTPLPTRSFLTVSDEHRFSSVLLATRLLLMTLLLPPSAC